MTYGQRLKAAREMAGLSIGQLARLSSVSQPALRALEADTLTAELWLTRELARCMDVRPEWLQTGAERQLSPEETRGLDKLATEDKIKLLQLLQMVAP